MTLQTLILAGGLGTRMRPATETVPKAMLPVAGRPFAAWQLDLLACNGVESVVYSVGHLGKQIEAFVGDGLDWGLSVRYSYEDEGLLGTGGAVRLAFDRDLLDDSFFVLYGDSYLPVVFEPIEGAFRECPEPALMTVFENDGRWGTSNVIMSDGRLVLYDKRPSALTESMRFIDFGLLAIEREVIRGHIEPGSVCDLADVLNKLSLEGELAGYQVESRFYEIGNPEGLTGLETYLRDLGYPNVRPQDSRGNQ